LANSTVRSFSWFHSIYSSLSLKQVDDRFTPNVVCSSVEELEHSGDAKDRSYLCPITKCDFIVLLVAVQSTLQPLVPLSATPQTKDFDLIQAVVGTMKHYTVA
jgi:hypothetical protein